MLLVVGLGNPGSDYAQNRHNVGFMVVDAIAQHYGLGPFRSKFSGQVTHGDIHHQRVVLLKPTTFMNLSGQSVSQAFSFYKLKIDQLLVIHDELDLPCGKIKYKLGGGHAGHNGLRSIHQCLGPDYHRLRMGIGHPGHKNRVSDYVLSNFSVTERDFMDQILDQMGALFSHYLQSGAQDYLTRVHQAIGLT